MKITVVGFPGIPQRVTDLVDAVSDALASEGFDVARTTIPALGLPEAISDENRATWNAFTLTPGALSESWRVARHLEALTLPQEQLLIVDYQGKGGVFALEQAMAGNATARQVWTLAGMSLTLGDLDTFGVAVGSDEEAESIIDWEMVQYRFSHRVIAVCDRARSLLETLDVASERLMLPNLAAPTANVEADGAIAVPEPVSRRSHTQEIVRGVIEVLASEQDATALISSADDDDLVWTGSTWETISVPVEVAGRVMRSDDPATRATTVILGDPFAVPGPGVAGAYVRGARLLVPRGSVAASIMPQATPWENDADLAALIHSPLPAGETTEISRAFDVVSEVRLSDDRRAHRVSVGVPVYADTRFLRDCVASILEQTQTPHEVVLYDDGSHDPEVSIVLEEIVSTSGGSVRRMEGSNRGVCAARNGIIASMTGDAFVLVDSDDILHSDFIETCAEALRANPDIDAVATWTAFFGDYNGIEAKPPFSPRVGMRENPIVSTAVLIDMPAWSPDISFADDLAFLYCEDWHVWSQIVASGGRFGLIPRPLVSHRVHGSSGATRRTDLAHRIGKQRATEPLVGGWPL